MSRPHLLFLSLWLFTACSEGLQKQPLTEKTVALKLETTTLTRTEGDCGAAKCAKVSLSYPTVQSGPSAMKKNLHLWRNDFLISLLDPSLELDSETSLNTAVEGFMEAYKDHVAKQKEPQNFTLEAKTQTLFKNELYLTLRMDANIHTGGPKPDSMLTIASFDLKTGKQVRPIDVVHDIERLYTLAEKHFKEKQKAAFEEGFSFSNDWPFDLPRNVGLVTEGLFFCYVPYEVAPPDMGFTEFVIPYDELEKQ